RPLSELGFAVLRLNAWNDSSSLFARDFAVSSPGVVVDIVRRRGEDGPCIVLDERASATLDSVPLRIETRGGTGSDEGEPIRVAPTFRLEPPPVAIASTLIVQDPSAAWTLEVDHLFASEFQLVATEPQLEIHWRDAPVRLGAEVSVQSSSNTGSCDDRVSGVD